MTGAPSPADRSARPPARIALAGALALAALGLAALGAVLLWPRADATAALPAPGVAAPVDAAGLRAQGYDVVAAVLAEVYEAFALTEEGAIYDRLAAVAAGEALEALYLERAGALASGGLPDQVVHELRLLTADWRLEGGALHAGVRWAVLGEVGHAEHTHMRGNAYGADLVLAPADGAWRLTGFDLTEVDRSGAGALTTLPGGHGAAPPG